MLTPDQVKDKKLLKYLSKKSQFRECDAFGQSILSSTRSGRNTERFRGRSQYESADGNHNVMPDNDNDELMDDDDDESNISDEARYEQILKSQSITSSSLLKESAAKQRQKEREQQRPKDTVSGDLSGVFKDFDTGLAGVEHELDNVNENDITEHRVGDSGMNDMNDVTQQQELKNDDEIQARTSPLKKCRYNEHEQVTRGLKDARNIFRGYQAESDRLIFVCSSDQLQDKLMS